MPSALERCIDAGLQAVRVSLNSFRPRVYAAYYRPIGYALDDVLESIRLAVRRGLRVSLNLLTHPGVTDDAGEIAAMEAFLRDVRSRWCRRERSTSIRNGISIPSAGRANRSACGAPSQPSAAQTQVGNFTHTH